MKKMLALLVAAMMLFGATTAMAEALAEEVQIQGATIDFDVTVVVPDGYTMEQTRTNDTVLLILQPESDGGTYYVLTVAYSDEYDGRTLNELSDDEKKLLLDVMDEDFAQAEVHDLTTDHGTEVYLLTEASPEAEAFFGAGFSIYKGYFVQIYTVRSDEQALTQDDIDLAMKILSEVWFVEK